MTPFTVLTATAAPLIRDNVDTDAIIPSREMRSTGKTGLAKGLFAGWRDDPDFVLDRPEFASAQILLGGANFGCGSSREHAVWALAEWGFRAVIAKSFAPIFAANCVRNGVAPIVLDAVDEIAEENPVTIDLPAQTVSLPGGPSWRFAIGAEDKAMLLEGLDAAPAIAAWQARDRAARPWIYL